MRHWGLLAVAGEQQGRGLSIAGLVATLALVGVEVVLGVAVVVAVREVEDEARAFGLAAVGNSVVVEIDLDLFAANLDLVAGAVDAVDASFLPQRSDTLHNPYLLEF